MLTDVIGAGVNRPALAASPEEIRRAVEEVFQRPEFTQRTDSLFLTLIRKLGEFFTWLGTLYGAQPVLFWIFLLGSIVLLVAMIALIVYQIRRAFGGQPANRRRHSCDANERLRRSIDFRRRAADCAERGEYTEAVRSLFLSLVYRFDESGRVGFRKAYTNREYLSLVGDRIETRDRLRFFVDAIDDHWYAQQPSERELYERCLAHYERLAS